MTTVQDVASLAAVSTASVSRVLTGTPGVSDGVRSRVLAAVEQLGYRPNAIARSLRTTGTQTIGLVVSDLLNPFFAELARGAEDMARRRGYNVIMGNADENPEQQDHYIRILLERQVDGLIVVPTEETSSLLMEAAERNSPVILADRPAANVRAPIVRAESTTAITALIRHLVALGHTRIAMIAGPETAGTSRERLATGRQALSECGLNLPDEYVTRGDFRRETGRRGVAELLGLRTPPQVIFAANGQMGEGALHEIRKRRLRVPEDIAICVFDDLPWFSLLDPGITAIAQPAQDIGAIAVDMLLRQLAGENVSDETLDCELIIRGSCGEDVNDCEGQN